MAYGENLAGRVRKLMAGRAQLVEKKMFGGVAFMVDGRMCRGVLNDDLVVRVGPERYAAAVSRPHARPMDFTGRALSGFVYVAPEGVKTGAALAKWLREAEDYVASQPARKSARAGRGKIRART